MSDSYQLRKDVDELRQQTEEINNNQTLVVKFDSESELYNEDATIDSVLQNYYDINKVNELISGAGGGGTGIGSFSINSNGHLIVEYPSDTNPFSIDSSGHLIYDTSASDEE